MNSEINIKEINFCDVGQLDLSGKASTRMGKHQHDQHVPPVSSLGLQAQSSRVNAPSVPILGRLLHGSWITDSVDLEVPGPGTYNAELLKNAFPDGRPTAPTWSVSRQQHRRLPAELHEPGSADYSPVGSYRALTRSPKFSFSPLKTPGASVSAEQDPQGPAVELGMHDFLKQVSSKDPGSFKRLMGDAAALERGLRQARRELKRQPPNATLSAAGMMTITGKR
jgi:hypothetical protein